MSCVWAWARVPVKIELGKIVFKVFGYTTRKKQELF